MNRNCYNLKQELSQPQIDNTAFFVIFVSAPNQLSQERMQETMNKCKLNHADHARGTVHERIHEQINTIHVLKFAHVIECIISSKINFQPDV